MATTPVAPKPATPTDDKTKAHDAKAHEKGAGKEAPRYPTLAPDAAWPLFYNGHRIVKQGDPPDKWIAMGRSSDDARTAVVTSPLTKEMEDAVKSGEYYLADDVVLAVPPPPATAAAAPTNVDVPMVSAMGQLASCTMGNWTGEPTSYAYAWQRDGAVIPGVIGATYSMTTADTGKSIGCIVTATNAAGSTAAPLSNTIKAP